MSKEYKPPSLGELRGQFSNEVFMKRVRDNAKDLKALKDEFKKLKKELVKKGLIK